MPELALSRATLQEPDWVEDLDVVPGQREILQQISALEGEIRSRPAEWQLRLHAAQAYASNGEFDAAATHLFACRDLVSDPAVTAGVSFNLGICLENMHQWREAAVAFE